MAEARTWTLTDTSKRVWQDRFEVKPSDIAARTEFPWTIRKETLHGGVSDGVDIIDVNNGVFSFSILPTRGMGLWRGEYKGMSLGWKAPVAGPVHPAYINSLEYGGLGWLKGFDEWVVRCGLSSNGPPTTDIVPDNNGNPSEVRLTLHGQIANTPARYVEIQVKPGPPAELIIIGIVEETMLFCPQLRLVTRISTVAGSNRVTVCDRVVNVREVPDELELLYHCNFGAPFLDAGATLVAPSLEVAPRDPRAAEGIVAYDRYEGPTPGFVEQCYWHDLAADAEGNTLAMLRNQARDLGVAVRFNKAAMPSLAQWKNTVGEREGYVTGIEPGINFPNPKGFERSKGRVKVLQPEESFTAELVFEVHDTVEGVAGVAREVEGLLAGRQTTVHPTPISKWSPGA